MKPPSARGLNQLVASNPAARSAEHLSLAAVPIVVRTLLRLPAPAV